MPRAVSVGHREFDLLRREGCFCIGKTSFVRERWDSKDPVTCITRPRRFGKTLAMSMVEGFLPTRYAGRGDLFEGLDIWRGVRFREMRRRRMPRTSSPAIFPAFMGGTSSSFWTSATHRCRRHGPAASGMQ